MGSMTMIHLTTTQDLQSQLQAIKQQKLQIEQEMGNLKKSPVGTVDLSFHRMKKQKTELQEKITKLNSILRPDIIA
jgi:hypothetical protein